MNKLKLLHDRKYGLVCFKNGYKRDYKITQIIDLLEGYNKDFKNNVIEVFNKLLEQKQALPTFYQKNHKDLHLYIEGDEIEKIIFF